MTGFPTRVQSPARRRPLLRSKSAAPKKKDTHVGVFLFWSGRRGSNSLPGIPRMADAIRRNPASPLDLTRSAPVEAASSSSPLCQIPKEDPILSDGVFFWSGRRGSNSLPRPWQGRALPDELRPQTQGELYRIFSGLSTLHFHIVKIVKIVKLRDCENFSRYPSSISTISTPPSG